MTKLDISLVVWRAACLATLVWVPLTLFSAGQQDKFERQNNQLLIEVYKKGYINGMDYGIQFQWKQDERECNWYLAPICKRLDKYESVQESVCDSVPSSYYEDLAPHQ